MKKLKLTGILKYVEGYDEVIEDLVSERDLKEEICQDDSGRQDRIAGLCYIQTADGSVYSVHSNETSTLIQSVPEIIRSLIYNRQEIGVSFETVEKPRGKRPWATKIEITDIETLTAWAKKNR